MKMVVLPDIYYAAVQISWKWLLLTRST